MAPGTVGGASLPRVLPPKTNPTPCRSSHAEGRDEREGNRGTTLVGGKTTPLADSRPESASGLLHRLAAGASGAVAAQARRVGEVRVGHRGELVSLGVGGSTTRGRDAPPTWASTGQVSACAGVDEGEASDGAGGDGLGIWSLFSGKTRGRDAPPTWASTGQASAGPEVREGQAQFRSSVSVSRVISRLPLPLASGPRHKNPCTPWRQPQTPLHSMSPGTVGGASLPRVLPPNTNRTPSRNPHAERRDEREGNRWTTPDGLTPAADPDHRPPTTDHHPGSAEGDPAIIPG